MVLLLQRLFVDDNFPRHGPAGSAIASTPYMGMKYVVINPHVRVSLDDEIGDPRPAMAIGIRVGLHNLDEHAQRRLPKREKRARADRCPQRRRRLKGLDVGKEVFVVFREAVFFGARHQKPLHVVALGNRR